MTFRLIGFAALILFLGLVTAPGAAGRSAAQATACDPLLDRPASHPYGYRLRGDRCEGIYVQEVAGTVMFVASFTKVFRPYDVSAARDLTIRWAAPTDGEVHLRAYGLRPKLYYRMDAIRPRASREYTWPGDVLGALKIGKPDVGLVAWIRQMVGAASREILLPLHVGDEGTTAGNDPYLLVLLAGVPLAEVYVSVATVGGDGRPARFIRDEEPLKYNYYPAERPIDIPIARPDTAGVYYVLIGASIANGGSLTTEAWFYHPPQ